jgi:hypothetical protein
MYNLGVAPVAMGVGAGATLPFLDMSPFWAVLATFALVACASAVRRVLPKIVVEGRTQRAPEQRHRPAGKHARR